MEQKHMLIVDDIAMNRELLQRYFMEDFLIWQACDGKEALALLEKETMDIVITDIVMPNLDGLGLIAEIRKQAKWDTVAVLALTDRGEEYELSALQAGADDFINKPFQATLLRHRVQSVLSQDRFQKKYRLYSLAYNHIKLPFAIVHLSGDKAHYQYANAAYAQLGNVTPEALLDEVKSIKNPTFVSFLSALQQGERAQKQTFLDSKTGKYYDIVAYQEEDDFYVLTAMENSEISAKKQQLEQYAHILEEITSANPNAVGILHVNLSQNLCLSSLGTERMFEHLPCPCAYTEAIGRFSQYLLHKTEQEAFAHFFHPDTLVQDYQNSIAQKHTDFWLQDGVGRVRWFTAHVKTARNPQTGDVECVAYCSDETDRKLSQRVIETVIHTDYDTLFYIDLQGKTAKMFDTRAGGAWSPAFSVDNMQEKMEGYLHHHYIGEDKAKFILENRLDALQSRMQDKQMLSVDYRILDAGEIRLKRGNYYWLDKQKNFLCFTRSDITHSFRQEQERAEELEASVMAARADEQRLFEEKETLQNIYYEELRQKDIMLTNLLENIPGGIAIYRIGERIDTLYSSEGVPKISGRTMEEYQAWVKDDPVTATVHPDDRANLLDVVARSASHGTPFQVTYRLLHKNGGYVWVMLSATKIREEAGVPIYYVVYTSIPEQVAQYTTLCENAPTAIYVVDIATHEIVFANQCAKEIAGIDRSLEGAICHQMIAKQNTPCAFCNCNSLSYEHFSEMSIVLPSNGVHYTMKRRRMHWDNREVFVVYLQDETHIIQEQEELKKRSLAEQANKAKTEFLSRVSHDMRTPMNGILGLAHLADEQTDILVLKQDMQQIQQAGRYLLNLINDTLDINQIELGKLELRPSYASGKEILQNIVQTAQGLAKQKHIHFSHALHGVSWKNSYLDATRLEQLLINLLSNAIKYTPEGGEVSFHMYAMEAPSGYLRDKYVIQDNGIGMSPAFIAQIFEPFTREHRKGVERAIGTGLGMSIVKRLVDLMGGEIYIDSALNQGTTVTVILQYPIAKDENEAIELNLEDKSSLQGKRILLCEDHPLNAKVARKLLEKQGMLVDWCADGKSGLDTFCENPKGYYDILLLDIRMPVLDGLETCLALRALDRSDAKTVPIIAMTANAFAEDVRQSKEVGMNAHLTKPIEPERLYQTLLRVLCGERRS